MPPGRANLVLCLLSACCLIDPLSGDHQPVRIDAIGRAGDQGAEFLLLVDEQVAHIVRQDGFNLIHLINKGLVQHRDPEGVAHLQFVQIREQNRTGQSTMTGQHGMGACTADRIGDSAR